MQTLVGATVDDISFGYFALSTVKLRLNLAQRELQGLLVRAGHSYYTKCVKTNTVANQKAYALPSDFYGLTLLERVVSGSGDTADTVEINFVTPAQRYQILDLSGTPTNYWFEKNNLILKPTPNSIVEVHLEYVPQIADMSADSDTADAPLQFHEFIPVLAVKKCFLQDNRTLGPIKEDLDRLEMELKKVADTRRDDGPRMVIMTGAWGDQ